LSKKNATGLASLLDHLVENFRHVGAAKLRRRVDREALATKVLDQRKRPESAAVKQAVGDKVHRPALVLTLRLRSFCSTCCSDVTAGSLPPQAKPFLAIQSMNAVLAHLEAFPQEQDVNAPVAIANSSF
jgi:hypothetical protein